MSTIGEVLIGGVAGEGAGQLAANASAPYAANAIGDYFAQPGHENQTAQVLTNVAGADIASGNPGDLTTGVTTVNAGRIEGNNVNTTSNLLGNTGTVIGNNITVNAATLTNDGAAAIIAGVNQVNLWVTGTVNNQNGATLYSLGDLNMAANGAKDANGYLFNQTGAINNLSSTMEVIHK